MEINLFYFIKKSFNQDRLFIQREIIYLLIKFCIKRVPLKNSIDEKSSTILTLPKKENNQIFLYPSSKHITLNT